MQLQRLILLFALLTLCPGYKLLIPKLKFAYLSLLNIVHPCIVPDTHTVPSIMYHSFFILSSAHISGLLAPFFEHFSRWNGISRNNFALSFSKHELGGFAYTKVESFQIHKTPTFPVCCGIVVVAFDRACPWRVFVPFLSNHIGCGIPFLDH